MQKLSVTTTNLSEPAWCHAHILNMSDEISLREAGVVHGAGIPKHQITRLEVDFDHLAAAFLEPLDIFLFEDEQVAELFALRWLILVVVLLPGLGEELVEKLARPLHDNQTTILGTVWLIVQQSLDTLHALAKGILITVRPW
jgi:hypothetical protein